MHVWAHGMCYSDCLNGVNNRHWYKNPITGPITAVGFVDHLGAWLAFLKKFKTFGHIVPFGK